MAVTERQERLFKEDLQVAAREIADVIERRTDELWEALRNPHYRSPAKNAEEATNATEQLRFLGELLGLYDLGKYEEAYGLLEAWGE